MVWSDFLENDYLCEKKSCKIEKIPIFAEIIGLKYPIM